MHDFYKGSGRGKRRNWIANRPEESPVFNGRIQAIPLLCGRYQLIRTGERCLILSTCLLNTHIRIGNAIPSVGSRITFFIQVYKDQFID